jgi:hypothetical protein
MKKVRTKKKKANSTSRGLKLEAKTMEKNEKTKYPK